MACKNTLTGRFACHGKYLLAALLVTVFVAGCESSFTPPQGAEPSPVSLLYEGYIAGLPELIRLDTTGGTPHRLLPPGTIAMDPTPSPDGRRIAFVVANYTEWTGDIFMVNRDGSGLRQLTFAPELDDSPAWSPDGQQLAFRSYRGGYEGEIWIMNADGTGTMNLTPTPLPAIIDNRRPDWSPDGQTIVYASNLGGDFGIWVMDAVGGGKRQLTNTPDFDTEPAWSPDGQRIAFRRSDGNRSDIFVMTSNGSAPLRLALPGEQRLPAWSPDGEWLAFVGQTTVRAQPEIFVMRQNGEDVRQLTVDPAWGGGLHPAWWRPDN